MFLGFNKVFLKFNYIKRARFNEFIEIFTDLSAMRLVHIHLKGSHCVYVK